jgi:hypothetical protein
LSKTEPQERAAPSGLVGVALATEKAEDRNKKRSGQITLLDPNLNVVNDKKNLGWRGKKPQNSHHQCDEQNDVGQQSSEERKKNERL